MRTYFNIKDFDVIKLREKSVNFSQNVSDSVQGKQSSYDVFLSHSTKNKDLVKKISQVLEDDYKLSAYIDWIEDNGTNRDDIAEKVKEAMNISKSFVLIKTKNSDESFWVAWETGYYDNINSDKIGILLIEEDDHTNEKFEHKEYLKNYELLSKEELISFVKNGTKFIKDERMKNFDEKFKNNQIKVAGASLTYVEKGNPSTKFYGDKQ